MDFHQLKIFSAVYRLRSFTGASVEMNISQPTISEHIKNLEAELSCRLFDRLGRSIMPTAQADQLFPRAQQLLDSFSSLREDLTRAGNQVRGKIIIGASTIPGTYIIPAMVVDFSRQFPDVTFEVIIKDTSEIVEMVMAHELFCGIVGATAHTDKLEYIPFIKDELVLVGRKELWSGRDIPPAELAGLPFLSREEGSGTRKCLEEYLEKAGIKAASLSTVATLGSTAAVKEAALQGLGITILSRLAVENELAEGRLQHFPIKGLQMTRDFYLLRHKHRTLPAHYQAFWDKIRGYPAR